MKTVKQEGEGEDLEDEESVEMNYHSHMYKTNSMFNLPNLHKNKLNKLSINVFSTTAAGNFFDMAQLMPDPKEF